MLALSPSHFSAKHYKVHKMSIYHQKNVENEMKLFIESAQEYHDKYNQKRQNDIDYVASLEMIILPN